MGGGAPVWIINIDGHLGACSSALLDALGLEDVAPDGILSGPAHDANLGKFTDHLASSITPAALAHGIAHFCNQCAAYGIGTVCALEGTDDSERDRMPSSPRSSRSASRLTSACSPSTWTRRSSRKCSPAWKPTAWAAA